MQKIAIFNMAFGFAIISLAAAAGGFIAWDLNQTALQTGKPVSEWAIMLRQSAHGHTNLFGMLHILFGLSLPYSNFSIKIKKVQTYGLIMGTLAVSLGLFLQSIYGPSPKVDLLGIVEGGFLFAALASICSHSCSLFLKLKN